MAIDSTDFLIAAIRRSPLKLIYLCLSLSLRFDTLFEQREKLSILVRERTSSNPAKFAV